MKIRKAAPLALMVIAIVSTAARATDMDQSRLDAMFDGRASRSGAAPAAGTTSALKTLREFDGASAHRDVSFDRDSGRYAEGFMLGFSTVLAPARKLIEADGLGLIAGPILGVLLFPIAAVAGLIGLAFALAGSN